MIFFFFFFYLAHQPPRTILETYQQFDEEICRLEGMCPGPRLSTIDIWTQFMERQRNLTDKDVIQLPLHLMDDDDNEIEEMKYDKQEHLNNDIYAITKVRQVCIFLKKNKKKRKNLLISVHSIVHSIYMIGNSVLLFFSHVLCAVS